MSLLEVKELAKNFKGLKAVNDVNLSVNEGDIIGLIGPNGAGKSTLFKLISGFIQPTKGEIYFKGRDITNIKPFKSCKLGLARTFQIVQIFPELTVLDNVKPAAFLHTKSVKEAETLAFEALSLVGLSEKSKVLSEDLNLAEKMAMELAKALATQADLILLDEVMAGLTPTEAQRIVETIRMLNEKKRISFVIVEHLLEALLSISHKVVVLDHGEIIVKETPDKVKENPQVIKAYLGGDVYA